MSQPNLKEPTINFTDEDRVNILKNQLLNWWINEHHSDIVDKCEKIAREHVEESKTDKETTDK